MYGTVLRERRSLYLSAFASLERLRFEDREAIKSANETFRLEPSYAGWP